MHFTLFTMFCRNRNTEQQRLTFQFRNFSVSRLLPIFWVFQFRFQRIWSRKKNQFQFREIWSRQKSLGFGFGKKILVLENLVLEKSFGLRKFGLGQKVSFLVLENLVSENKKKITRKKVNQRNNANLLFENISPQRNVVFYIIFRCRTPYMWRKMNETVIQCIT